MKRFISFFGGIITILLILWGISIHISSQANKGSSSKLVIYNWGDYIDPDLIKDFTAETGIQVDYETFDSNESMYTKIKQGGTTYDIAVPSEYMIAKMIDEEMLVAIDHDKISGLENIGPEFLNQSFDPGNKYSVPYFWGTLGIIYNSKMVDRAPKEWEDLWGSHYKDSIMLVDGAREGMGMGLQVLGYSLNSDDPNELQEAANKLYQLTPNIKAIVADEIKGYMIQEEAAIAVSFSGEASEMLDANDDLAYVVPSKGSNLWFDNIVIPKTSKNREAAHQFISFMLRPDNALRNAEYVGYSTPNERAKAMLDKETRENQAFYPIGKTLENLEVYDNLGAELLGSYNDLYLQFKMYRK